MAMDADDSEGHPGKIAVRISHEHTGREPRIVPLAKVYVFQYAIAIICRIVYVFQYTTNNTLFDTGKGHKSHQLKRSNATVVPINGRSSIAENVWFSEPFLK